MTVIRVNVTSYQVPPYNRNGLYEASKMVLATATNYIKNITQEKEMLQTENDKIRGFHKESGDCRRDQESTWRREDVIPG
jgi:hypothetical protein